MSTLQTDENELVQQVIARDQQAFSELYRRYSVPIYSLSLRILHDESRAEKATQNTFLKLWFGAANANVKPGNLLHWLLVVARQAAIAELHGGEKN